MPFLPPDWLKKLLHRIRSIPRWAWGLLLLAAVLVAARPVDHPGGTGSVTPFSNGEETVSQGGLVLDVIFKLGIVVVLIYVSLLLLKRWQDAGGKMPGGILSMRMKERQLTVLETTRLSPRQALHLVKVGSQTVLIGATDQALTLLTEVDDLPAPAIPDQTTAKAGPGFSRLLAYIRAKE